MKLFVCLFVLMTAWAQNPAPNVIDTIEFQGLSRVPESSVRALVHTKAGDVYDEDAIHQDFKALWDTGRFDDVLVKRETSGRGGIIVRFMVTERAASIERIEFLGLSRVPEDAVRAIISTHTGDVYDEDAIHRDFKALWDTGRFDDIQVRRETLERNSVIVRFVVTERP